MSAGSDSQPRTQASYGEDGESVEWWNMCWRKVHLCPAQLNPATAKHEPTDHDHHRHASAWEAPLCCALFAVHKLPCTRATG